MNVILYVTMSITDHQGEGKEGAGHIPAYPLLILILLLSITAAFGLGILAGMEMGQGSGEDRLWIEELSQSEAVQPAAAAAAETTTTPVTTGKYVASKSGTKYHLPTCSGTKRIKEENKVWFETKEQAVAAGYGPAANCPGL